MIKNLRIRCFIFFNPDTGKELYINDICNKTSFIIEKSLSYCPDINYIEALFFEKQSINIFNSSDVFYNDLCCFFESPNGKNVPIKERFLLFYPNLNFCDDNCNNIGVNLTSMKAICECKLKNLLEGTKNATNFVGIDIPSIIESLSLDVINCYKTIFQ